MKKISIIMAYYNRREQLKKTLDSIHYFGDPEIIIVDDASDERIDDLTGFTLIRIEPEEKWWINPCIPYNMGFSEAKGDIIIIQNPECIHCGDILSYVQKLTPGNLFSFASYSLDYHLQYEGFPLKELREKIASEPQRCQVAHHGWYNHSVYRPEALHFCNALLRKDLKLIGGFDERFANGVSFDDNEILIRIERAGIKIQIIDDPFVIHQKHERTDYTKLWTQRTVNYEIFNRALTEHYIKPPLNKYYK